MKASTFYTDKINITGSSQSTSATMVRGWYRILLRNGAYIKCGTETVVASPSSGEVQCVIPFEDNVTVEAYTAANSSSTAIVRLLNGA